MGNDTWISIKLTFFVLAFFIFVVAVYPSQNSDAFVIGQNAHLEIGQPIFGTSMEATSQDNVDFPTSSAFDSSGNLWVADFNNNRILEYTEASLGSSNPSAALELGQPAGASQFTTNIAATSQSGLTGPQALAFDSSGNLWVADFYNSRILEYTCTATSSCTDGNNAALELGQTNAHGFTTGNGDDGGISATSLFREDDLKFDHSGNLWVADDGNSRVLEYTCTATSSCTNGNSAALELGQTNAHGFTTGHNNDGGISAHSLIQEAGLSFD